MNRLSPVYPAIQLGFGKTSPTPPLGPYGIPRIIRSRTKRESRFVPQDQAAMLGQRSPFNGLIVQFSGPTGAGKGRLSSALMAAIKGSEFLVTCTTREARQGEAHGKNYWFLSDDEFDRYLAAGDFIETNTFATGKRYGTLFRKVSEQMDWGGIIISDINVDGAAQMRQKAPMLHGEFCDIFVMPPGDSLELQLAECRRRAEGSPDKRDDLELRLAEAPAEIARRGEFAHIIVNGDFETAFREVLKIVVNARTAQLQLSYPCAV